MAENINVAFAVNNAYAQHLCTAVVSMADNNREHFFHVKILSNDFSEEAQNNLRAVQKDFPNFDFEVVSVDEELFKNLKITIDRITVQTYYRYVIAELFSEMDKCLYLDADLVVNGDLGPLWREDLTGYYAAGVEDVFILSKDYKKHIGFGAEDLYVNAGMLLMNLAEIRKDKLVGELFAKTAELADVIDYQDQDILNIVFRGKIKQVDNIYNFTSSDYKFNRKRASEAVVIHYTGSIKPWNMKQKSRNKLAEIYHKYVLLTPYRDFEKAYRKSIFWSRFFARIEVKAKKRVRYRILGIQISLPSRSVKKTA